MTFDAPTELFGSHNAVEHICRASKWHRTAIYSSCINTTTNPLDCHVFQNVRIGQPANQPVSQPASRPTRWERQSCEVKTKASVTVTEEEGLRERERAERVPKHWTHPNHTNYRSLPPTSPPTSRDGARGVVSRTIKWMHSLHAFIGHVVVQIATNWLCMHYTVDHVYIRSECSAWYALSSRLCISVYVLCFVLYPHLVAARFFFIWNKKIIWNAHRMVCFIPSRSLSAIIIVS